MKQVLHKGQILEWKVPCPNQVLIVYVVVNLNLIIFDWSETYMNSISVLHNGPNSIATSAFSIWTVKKFAWKGQVLELQNKKIKERWLPKVLSMSYDQ